MVRNKNQGQGGFNENRRENLDDSRQSQIPNREASTDDLRQRNGKKNDKNSRKGSGKLNDH